MISVITPTRNRPELLRENIDAFLKQDYKNKEQIIIIDGGTDEVYEKYYKLIDEYKKHKELYFIPLRENHGCPAALNVGIKFCHGDYITIIADDDLLYDNNSLSSRILSFDKTTEVIYTGFKTSDLKVNINSTVEAAPVDRKKIFEKDYINIQSMMWKKSIHKRIGYFSEDLINNEDWEFKIKCLMECEVKAVNIISVVSRYHAENKSMVNRQLTNECGAMLLKRMGKLYAAYK